MRHPAQWDHSWRASTQLSAESPSGRTRAAPARDCALFSGPLLSITISLDTTGMSGSVEAEPRTRQRSETIHVVVKSLTNSKDFIVRGGSSVRQVRGTHTGSHMCVKLLDVRNSDSGVCVCVAEVGSRRAPGSPGRAAGADPLRPGPQRIRTPESPQSTRWLSPPPHDPKVHGDHHVL